MFVSTIAIDFNSICVMSLDADQYVNKCAPSFVLSLPVSTLFLNVYFIVFKFVFNCF